MSDTDDTQTAPPEPQLLGDDDLTPVEAKFLAAHADPTIKAYLAERRVDGLATRAAAYRKVAAAAGAEASALLAVAALNRARGEVATVAEATARIRALEAQVRAAESREARARAALTARSAADAMAVHSDE